MADTQGAQIPLLDGDAAAAVAHRGGHIQIIAAAGSGKTEVVSQRVAGLLADGVTPESIAAFTFTDKAAAELKQRIRERVTAAVGERATDTLGRLQVGTIHAYCFRLLQTYQPTYETYSLIDDNQLVSLLVREGGGSRLDLKRFDPDGKNRLFRGVETFLRSVDVMENEMLADDDLPDDEFRETLRRYYEMLDRYRLLTFGQQIVRAVMALGKESVQGAVTSQLAHLVVDEYQDVNPAQERLIRRLAKPDGAADLVVVGDDDQAIYQWRGSSVDNIVTFADRYPDVTQFDLLTNRRSRPPIIDVANRFAVSIPGRLPKHMEPYRPVEGPAVDLCIGYEDEATEADTIAMTIEELRAQGVPYQAMSVLVRARTAYPRILDAFKTCGIPVQPGGRTGLFQQDSAAVLGATFAWLVGIEWTPGRYITRQHVDLDELLDAFLTEFGGNAAVRLHLQQHLLSWRSRVGQTDQSVNLIGELYALLEAVGAGDWDTDDAEVRNQMGTIARFTKVLADYESVHRRARRDPNAHGEQVGGQDRGDWYYKTLAILLVNYANGAYDDFNGEEDSVTDAVDLGTVHGAKGLEWPVVFLRSLTDGRFPSSRTGGLQHWLVPQDMFAATRYEGTDTDERRLFYVALTRARDWISLSSHLKVNKQSRRPSPYLTEVASHAEGEGMPVMTGGFLGATVPDLNLSYSELASYMSCGQSYLLRNRLGFMPPVANEIGYGNAVHHVMRVIAEHAKAAGLPPSPREINQLLDTDFYLPFANKPAHREMKERARKLVFSYVNDHVEELGRTWETERPFELYLDGVVVSGRADVIYDKHDGVPANLAIVDYKTSTDGDIAPLQLQVYADAGRREGLSVVAAYVHDMGEAMRHNVPVGETDVAAAEKVVIATADSLRSGDFTPSPEKRKCRACDVRTFCQAAIT